MVSRIVLEVQGCRVDLERVIWVLGVGKPASTGLGASDLDASSTQLQGALAKKREDASSCPALALEKGDPSAAAKLNDLRG